MWNSSGDPTWTRRPLLTTLKNEVGLNTTEMKTGIFTGPCPTVLSKNILASILDSAFQKPKLLTTSQTMMNWLKKIIWWRMSRGIARTWNETKTLSQNETNMGVISIWTLFLRLISFLVTIEYLKTNFGDGQIRPGSWSHLLMRREKVYSWSQNWLSLKGGLRSPKHRPLMELLGSLTSAQDTSIILYW